ncbi:MAG: TIGR03619 family F420-dependent LLM class oxidoreductase [Jatrophihabitans sp.]|uniref:TIGR03619 family F420-dependent LLM class oxidoreductase n=1 Tax=Jatrophihabitans sp. TaxID=1932789 RepID=UPI003F7DB60A
MSDRKFTLAVAMNPLDEVVALAQMAEECGFASIALPDSLFYMEHAAEKYPYTPDGGRFWTPETPWPDPLVLAGAIGVATTTIRSYTQVMKLASRNPLLLARQLLTVAALTKNRFGFGIGIGWSPEETRWCGAPWEGRGRRVDEMLDVIELVLGGGMVEHHGEFFDFDRLQMSPAPTERMPIYVGGHTDIALRRAARYDGWTSAMIKYDDLVDVIARLTKLRADLGRADQPYEIQAVCIDRFGIDGYRETFDAGVTDIITMPWLFYGAGYDAPLQAKLDGIRRFADETMTKALA